MKKIKFEKLASALSSSDVFVKRPYTIQISGHRIMEGEKQIQMQHTKRWITAHKDEIFWAE